MILSVVLFGRATGGETMATRDKRIAAMRRNPRSVTFEVLEAALRALDLVEAAEAAEAANEQEDAP